MSLESSTTTWSRRMASMLRKESESVWKFWWRSSSVRKKAGCFCMVENTWCAEPRMPLPSSYLLATVVICGSVGQRGLGGDNIMHWASSHHGIELAHSPSPVLDLRSDVRVVEEQGEAAGHLVVDVLLARRVGSRDHRLFEVRAEGEEQLGGHVVGLDEPLHVLWHDMRVVSEEKTGNARRMG